MRRKSTYKMRTTDGGTIKKTREDMEQIAKWFLLHRENIEDPTDSQIEYMIEYVVNNQLAVVNS